LTETKKSGLFLYLVLAGIFIALLITSNLIFKKFFSLDFFGLYEFKLSVGLLPYPLTFLITDLISEIYGLKRSNQVVMAGLICSLLMMGVVMLADALPLISEGSPVDSDLFHLVFGSAPAAVFASMLAYISAQYADIRIFHFWKQYTKGKHLWLRNNVSTIIAQLIDTTIIFTLLCALGTLPWELYGELFFSSFVFKVIIALCDTPFFYLFTGMIKKHFKLGLNDELKIG